MVFRGKEGAKVSLIGAKIVNIYNLKTRGKNLDFARGLLDIFRLFSIFGL